MANEIKTIEITLVTKYFFFNEQRNGIEMMSGEFPSLSSSMALAENKINDNCFVELFMNRLKGSVRLLKN